MNAMSYRRSTRSVLLIVCLTVLISVGAARPIGMAHAYLAHSVGIHALMGYGLCNGPCRVAREILKERYGIHKVTVAGCEVWGPEMWYSNGFDEVMIPLIVRDRGKDVFV